MTLSIDQFVANHNTGKFINNGGVACVAVANQYETEVVGGGWIGTPLTGYANDWWNNFNNSAVELANYVRVGADQPVQDGDIGIWTKYPTSGLPHIALIRGQNPDGTLRCFTQNPQPAHMEGLVKTGLAGYLRPKKFIQVQTTAAVVNAPVGAVNEVVTLKSVVNVRVAPNTQNTPLHTNPAGGQVSIVGLVHGENVTQNGVTTDVWCRTWNGYFIWAGNTNAQY